MDCIVYCSCVSVDLAMQHHYLCQVGRILVALVCLCVGRITQNFKNEFL